MWLGLTFNTREERLRLSDLVRHTNWATLQFAPPQVSTLVLGSQNEDYPFACPPGVYGGAKIGTQISPVCVGACPAGKLCPSATHTPQRTPLRE